MKQIKWGILSTAKIGVNQVIPAIQASKTGTVYAIASRDAAKAEKQAEESGIPISYGSYESLLDDDAIDAIYNPLPNHLHVPWTIKAMQAGKHVLCEKPIALDAAEAEQLIDVTDDYPQLKVMEAFMYRFHPQWERTRSLIEDGRIGDLQTIHSIFSFYNDDPEDIRNKPNMGGGGLMDIGCYCISTARFLYGTEPGTVYGEVEIDPNFGVDTKASGILTFGKKTSTFTCSTLMQNFQRVMVFGTAGMIEIEVPFNPDATKPASIHLTTDEGRTTLSIETANHYVRQADAFCHAIINNTNVPTPLHDAVANMKVIDAMFESGKNNQIIQL